MSKECEHPAFFNKMCVSCGKLFNDINDSSSTPPLSSIVIKGKVLQVSKKEAQEVQRKKIDSLYSKNKLALVLDLDHTLLHAIQIDGPVPQNPVKLNGEIHHLPIEEKVNGVTKHLVMKKRPYLDQFLERINKTYEIFIYTAGTRRYAEAVVKVLDPNKKYINDRIVSRSEDTPAKSLNKNLSRLFLQDSSMAVILDDREDVWKGPQGDQLILVRPYQFFHPNSQATQIVGHNTGAISEVNNAPGMLGGGSPTDLSPNSNVPQVGPISPILSLVDSEDKPSGSIIKYAPQASVEYTEADDQLIRCLDILEELHRDYYARKALEESEVANNNSEKNSDSNSSDSINDRNNISKNDENNKELNSLLKDSQNLKGKDLIKYNTKLNKILHTSKSTHTLKNKLSVANLLNKKKKRILKGCVISFSGIIPTNDPSPKKNLFYSLAVSLGAKISLQLTENTTHLLAFNVGTRKVNECLKNYTNIWVLHPDWLFYCKWSLSRSNEKTFLLVPLNNSIEMKSTRSKDELLEIDDDDDLFSMENKFFDSSEEEEEEELISNENIITNESDESESIPSEQKLETPIPTPTITPPLTPKKSDNLITSEDNVNPKPILKRKTSESATPSPVKKLRFGPSETYPIIPSESPQIKYIEDPPYIHSSDTEINTFDSFDPVEEEELSKNQNDLDDEANELDFDGDCKIFYEKKLIEYGENDDESDNEEHDEDDYFYANYQNDDGDSDDDEILQEINNNVEEDDDSNIIIGTVDKNVDYNNDEDDDEDDDEDFDDDIEAFFTSRAKEN